jgi:hypothetical protein
MIPHRGNPAISFQVYFKNGIHKLTIATQGCSRQPSASIFRTKESCIADVKQRLLLILLIMSTRVYDLQGLQEVEKNSWLPNNRILLVLLTLLFIFEVKLFMGVS